MAIAFRSAGASSGRLVPVGSGSVTATIGKPAGVQPSDVVLAVVIFEGSAGGVTPPAGWTEVATVGFLGVYQALGSVASYTFSFVRDPFTDQQAGFFALAYSGVDPLTPIDVFPTRREDAGPSTLVTANSLTTVSNDAWLVGVFFAYTSDVSGFPGTWSAEFGTSRGNVSAQSDAPVVPPPWLSADACDAVQAVAGVSGNKTATHSLTGTPVEGILFALRPIAASVQWTAGDRAKETTTTTGVGAIALGGAVANFRAFSAIASDQYRVRYTLIHQTASEWESGVGIYNAAANTLTRSKIEGSSNAGAVVNLSAGTKDVFCELTAAQGLLSITRRSQETDQLIPPGTSAVIVGEYEIAAGYELEIGAGAELEIR
jgi:hypothetical protein